MNRSKARDNGIDLLHIVAIFWIMMAHVIGDYNVLMEGGQVPTSYLMTLYMEIGGVSVNIFFLITGAFVLANARNQSFRRTYRHMAEALAIPTLIFSLYYFVYSMLPGVIKWDMEKIKYVFFEALEGRPFYHLWYMYALLAMYLFVPAIVRLRLMAGEKTFEVISVLIFISSAACDFTSQHKIQWDPASAYRYIGFLFAGYVVRRHARKDNKVAAGLLALGLAVALAMSGIAFASSNGIHIPWILSVTKFVLEEICPVLFFASFSCLEIPLNCLPLESLCFLAYLFHAGIRDAVIRLMDKFMGRDILLFILPMEINVLLLTASLFAVSFVVALMYRRMQEAVEEKWHVRERMYMLIRAVFIKVFRIQST